MATTRKRRIIRLSVEVDATDMAAEVVTRMMEDLAAAIGEGTIGIKMIDSDIIETTNPAAIKAATK